MIYDPYTIVTEQGQLAQKDGKARPFIAILRNINPIDGSATIESHGPHFRVRYQEPHEGISSWIRATPDANTNALVQFRSDTNQPEIIRYVEFNHRERVLAFQNGEEPYRDLQPGEIDIHSSGFAGTYYSARPFSQNRGGVVEDWRDQDNLEHGAFAPVHRRVLQHHINNQFSDEEAFGVVSRPFGETGRIYPKTLQQDFAKSWEMRMKPYGPYPNDMFWYRHGNVIDDDGLEEISFKTGLPLRLKNIWYTGLPPVPLETSFEIDVAGNAAFTHAFSAISGFDFDCPLGNFHGFAGLNWGITSGLDHSIFCGKSYSAFSLVDLQMRNLLTTFDINAAGDVKFQTPLTGFDLKATGDIELRSGVEGFVWKATVTPLGAFKITQKDGATSSFEISPTGDLEFTNGGGKNTLKVTASGEIALTNTAGEILISPSGHVIVNGFAQGVDIGTGGLEPIALGQQLKIILDTMIDLYSEHTVVSPVGNCTPPTNAPAMQALKAQTVQMLSKFNKVS